jgi:hypothetical protein
MSDGAIAPFAANESISKCSFFASRDKRAKIPMTGSGRMGFWGTKTFELRGSCGQTAKPRIITQIGSRPWIPQKFKESS